MKLWECIYYHKFADNKPYCERNCNLNQCSGECEHNYSYGQWREFIKKNKVFKGVRVNVER